MINWVEEVLQKHFPEQQVTGLEKLNNGHDVLVYRVILMSDDGIESSVIVKGVSPDCVDEKRAEGEAKFNLEKANYLFLDSQCGFDRYPKILAFEETVFIVEDLGKDAHDYPSEMLMQEEVAKTLTQLHLSTRNKHFSYQQLTLPILQNTACEIQYGETQCSEFFNQGKQYLLARLNSERREVQLQCDLQKVQQAIESIAEDSAEVTTDAKKEKAESYLGLIHCDSHSRRQSVHLAEGKMCLLDFEQARYSHVLLDVAILLLGKFDWDRQASVYFLNNPFYSKTFISVYKRCREAAAGASSTLSWNDEMDAALIYVCIMNIGILNYLSQSFPSVLSQEEWLYRMSQQLLALLSVQTCYQAVVSVLSSADELN